jgi:hypothetical protein
MGREPFGLRNPIKMSQKVFSISERKPSSTRTTTKQFLFFTGKIGRKVGEQHNHRNPGGDAIPVGVLCVACQAPKLGSDARQGNSVQVGPMEIHR